MRVIKCVGRKGHKLWRCPLVPSFAVVVSGRSNNFSEAVEISYGTSTGPAQRLVISSLCLLGTGTRTVCKYNDNSTSQASQVFHYCQSNGSTGRIHYYATERHHRSLLAHRYLKSFAILIDFSMRSMRGLLSRVIWNGDFPAVLISTATSAPTSSQ